jgi:Glycosyltransferase like family 2
MSTISTQLYDCDDEVSGYSSLAITVPLPPMASLSPTAHFHPLTSQSSFSSAPSNELSYGYPFSSSVTTLNAPAFGKASELQRNDRFSASAESSTTKLLGTNNKEKVDDSLSDCQRRDFGQCPWRQQASVKQKPGLLSRLRQSFGNNFDVKAILHLLDFRPWFWPITTRKYVVLFMIACSVAGIIVSNYYFHWIQTSLTLTRSYMFPVLIITVCAEPIITFAILIISRIPEIPKDELFMILNDADEDLELYLTEKCKVPSGPFETALVIPCHHTDEATIRTTIESALPHFRAQDIFIVDNGPNRYPKHPTCNFRQSIHSIHHDIVYIWSPIGSKNVAQLIGALAATDYKYIMTVDDDVCIPKNFHVPKEMIDDKFKAVAYGIKAIDSNGNTPLWLVAWQDVEYRLSGLSKAAEDRLCGVLFPHGAGWFIERESFTNMLENHHPMDFIAEDCNAGLGMHKMGKGIRFDGRCFLATEAPGSFFGPGLNWWKQRQKSWEMGRHGRLFAFLNQFLFCHPVKKTPQG